MRARKMRPRCRGRQSAYGATGGLLRVTTTSTREEWARGGEARGLKNLKTRGRLPEVISDQNRRLRDLYEVLSTRELESRSRLVEQYAGGTRGRDRALYRGNYAPAGGLSSTPLPSALIN